MLVVCFRLAIAEGWADRVPERPILRGSKVRHRELTDAEEDQLYQHSEAWARDLWRFLLETGVRISEALRITDEDRRLAFSSGKLALRDTKNGKDRMIPLTSEANRCLWAHRWADKSSRQVSFAWEQARQKMGLRSDPGFVVHCLRHTCASRLLQGGVELEKVSKWLGHSSVKVTERYAHLRTDDLVSGVRVLEGRE
jgi:integrase